MKTRILKSAVLWAMVGVMAFFSSCSSDNSQLLSSIPSNSAFVSSVNGEKLIKALDWKFDDGKLVIPEDQRQAFGMGTDTDDVCRKIAAIAPQIDYKHIFIVSVPSGRMYITFVVKDVEKLVSALKDAEMTEAEARAPFDEVLTADRVTVMIADKQGWLVSAGAETATEFVKSQLDEAGKASMAQAPGVSEAFGDGDGIADVAINMPLFAKNMNLPADINGQEWSFMECDIESNAIEIEGKSYDKNGNVVKSKGMQNIDTDFLRYVPGEWNYGFAAGLTSDFDWDTLFRSLGSVGGFQGAAVIEILKPYLRAIDGTVAVAGSIPSGDDVQALNRGDLSAIQALVMVHMDQSKVNEAVEQLASLMKQAGMTYQQRSNGIYSLTVGGGVTLDFGSVNGSLAISTISLKPNAQNSFTKIFQGKQMAGFINLPTLSQFAPDADFGLDVTFGGSSDESKVLVKLQGTNTPILPAIIKLLARS